MDRRTDTRDLGTANSVKCFADSGVAVDIVYADRMVWIVAEKLRFTVAVGLDDLIDVGYNVKSRTLGIALDSSLNYIEIPCTRRQAENILAHVGWDISRMHIQHA
ncbi:hypothetical protein [Burkholderia ubonensis]|uniref:hypothetical protein n=1 Tax=Burkholderia ubonensis TaxID=101571 RepID=UPI000F56162A|nr:hypothetical protein [Burkholderia ubonensis]RQP27709.1 hypothetical protein DF155_30760 [Burkholderia ubonensis]RQP29725.1 hypothetical protein DF154_31995 [Burkholderia ubonensis]RQP31881.1 hypothetical protein DF156_30980 [Burkholderia ubonensis]RQP47824.1 hypothetical protein DF144_30685 [Burkholderia ubonensis]RQP50841.1 hypothetical protein DF151_30580 [Burkholderia ubonensis]